jgi:beta-lactamase class C
MWKSIYAGVFVLIIILFSSLDLGSVTDDSSESYNLAKKRSYTQQVFDSIALSYDEYLRHAVDSFKSPGAAVAIVYKGDLILVKGYGVKKTNGSDSIDLHTAFRIGSVSKGFASVLTGILVDEGYLSWDDRIKEHMKDFRLKDTTCASQLTVRHVLSHTTGFPNHTFTDMLDNGFNYDQIKTNLANVQTVAKPGQVYSYQNVVYSLIGDVLLDATGEDYNRLLHEKIFVPLNMNEASTDFISFSNNLNSAFPHVRSGNSWRTKPKNNRYYSVSPASGINASASDMAQWLLALTGYYPQVVSQDNIHEISKAFIETPKKSAYRKNWRSLEKTSYGLGWRIFRYDQHELVYHGGFVEGFRAEIAFDPAEGVGIAVLFNSNTPVAAQCIPHFFDILFKHLPQAAPNTEFATLQVPVAY